MCICLLFDMSTLQKSSKFGTISVDKWEIQTIYIDMPTKKAQITVAYYAVDATRPFEVETLVVKYDETDATLQGLYDSIAAEADSRVKTHLGIV